MAHWNAIDYRMIQIPVDRTHILRHNSILRPEQASGLLCTVQCAPSRRKPLRTRAVVLNQDAVLKRERSAARGALPIGERTFVHRQLPDPGGSVVAGGDDVRAVRVERGGGDEAAMLEGAVRGLPVRASQPGRCDPSWR